MDFLSEILEIAEKGGFNLNLKLEFSGDRLTSALVESRYFDFPIWDEVLNSFKEGILLKDFLESKLTLATGKTKKEIERTVTEEEVSIKEVKKKSRERIFRIELLKPIQIHHGEFEQIIKRKKSVYMWKKKGSFAPAFSGQKPPSVSIEIHRDGQIYLDKIPLAFVFPPENDDPEPDLNKRGDPRIRYYRSSGYIKLFPVLRIPFESGDKRVEYEITGMIGGEKVRNALNPERIQHSDFFGLYLLKDYTPVENRGDLIGNWKKYIHFLILVNCDGIELDEDGKPLKDKLYKSLITSLRRVLHSKSPLEELGGKPGLLHWEIVKKYFSLRKQDLSHFATSRAAMSLERKLKSCPGFWNLEEYRFLRGEPRNETETLLLFQAMLSLGYDEIDFIVKSPGEGEGTYIAYDLQNGSQSKLIRIRHKLSDFTKDVRNFDGAYALVCWKADLKENTEVQLRDCRVKYVREGKKHYFVSLKDPQRRWRIYVLSEILKRRPLDLIGET